jgi:hypothetical protein
MFRRVFLCLAINSRVMWSINRGGDCAAYDYMHTAGGPIAPCAYVPNYVFNVTIGENSDQAFSIDGSHLQSKGAIAYLKGKNNPPLDTDDFMKCQMADCSDLASV